MKAHKVFFLRAGTRVLQLCIMGLVIIALGAFRPVLAVGGPDLTIVKSHVGNFTEGDTGKTYTLTVSNVGDAPTNGTTITVADLLPAGLTATGFSGTGWSCTLDPLECTRTDVLAASGSFSDITLTVDVGVDTAALLTNEASATGGGDATPDNNVDFDETTIVQVADLTINKSHTGNFTQGEQGKTYTLTVTNNGDGSTDGSTVTVTDTLPTGLTATALSGTGWGCTLGTLTCTRSDALATGLSYSPITLTVNVAYNTSASITNQAAVSGGGEVDTSNNADSDPTTVIQKSDLIITNVTSSPAAPIPGQPFDINVTVMNRGGVVTESIVYRDIFIDRNPMDFLDPVTGCVSIDADYFRADLNDTMPPGVSDTKAVSITGGLSLGTHQIWVYTDATCINGESVENNNAYVPITIVTGTRLTIKSGGAYDGWIRESRETSGNGNQLNKTSTLLYIGDDASNRQYRSILSFNTAGVPDNAVITKVSLKFKHVGFVGTNPFTTHVKLLVDMRKGVFGTFIALQNSDFKAFANRSPAATISKKTINGWYMKLLGSANFSYINKTGVTQFRLRFSKDDNNDFGSDFLKIYSGNAGAVNRPQLVIEYYVP